MQLGLARGGAWERMLDELGATEWLAVRAVTPALWRFVDDNVGATLCALYACDVDALASAGALVQLRVCCALEAHTTLLFDTLFRRTLVGCAMRAECIERTTAAAFSGALRTISSVREFEVLASAIESAHVLGERRSSKPEPNAFAPLCDVRVQRPASPIVRIEPQRDAARRWLSLEPLYDLYLQTAHACNVYARRDLASIAADNRHESLVVRARERFPRLYERAQRDTHYVPDNPWESLGFAAVRSLRDAAPRRRVGVAITSVLVRAGCPRFTLDASFDALTALGCTVQDARRKKIYVGA